MTDSNIPDALPKSPEECELLETVIDRLLTSIPEVWDSVDQQKLTSLEQRGLFLLTAAGMVERRIGMRISSLIDQFSAEIEVTATGEYGFIEALQLVIAQMWATAKDVYSEWRATHGEVPSAHCEVLHESWRLTDQGVVARNDLGKTHHDRRVVFDFVLRRFYFAVRPAVRGSGVLVKFIPATAPSTAPPASVSINNWDDGAKQFAEQFFKLFGEAARAKSDSPPPPSLWRFEPGEAIYKDIRIPIKGSAWAILKKLAENFGRPVLKETLVDLMDENSTASPETWLRDNLTIARDALRSALNLDKTIDPIPNTEKGRNAAWKLDDKFF